MFENITFSVSDADRFINSFKHISKYALFLAIARKIQKGERSGNDKSYIHAAYEQLKEVDHDFAEAAIFARKDPSSVIDKFRDLAVLCELKVMEHDGKKHGLQNEVDYAKDQMKHIVARLDSNYLEVFNV